MKLSIVIPAYNEEKLLPATLKSVATTARVLGERGADWEIIVCDNNSTDTTAQVAAAAGAQVVHEPVNQISRARNTGAAASRADWILFLDADSTPSQALFQELATAMANPTVLGGGTLLKSTGATWLFRFLLWVWNWNSRLRKEAAGAFLYCRRDAFVAISGFSQKLFVAEEIEFAIRLKKWGKPQGLRFYILTKAPLETSDRKAHLYSTWEMLRFVLRSATSRLKNLTRREDCGIWYDGRR